MSRGRTMERTLIAICAILLTSCQSISPPLSFEAAKRLAQTQPHDVAYAYEDKWDAFNNANKLDEKDGCYQKARGLTQQVLVLDNIGVVTQVIADIDNEKSRCFRNSYLHVQFPAPPFAPYYMYLKME
jgi:hypothetical protein